MRLRDDILKLGSSLQGDGEWDLTPGDQFTQRLLSNSGALYDESGRYLGQGFRFSLPKVPNTNECAERIWDVQVRLSGGSKLKAWTETHERAALRLRQRNTFASRLCTDTSQSQTSFVRPSWTAEDWPKPGDEMGFTETVVKASAGTSFLDFETQGDGAFGAMKLRGRGLYADYEIFFPWDGLLSQDNHPTDFPLDDVIDVWLRFDPAYVALER